jgi:hypothetical protein
MITGVHSYYAKEGFTGLYDFEITTWHYSILQWKKFNGPLILCCNERFKEYAISLGFLSLYDRVDEIPEPDEDINKAVFWAASKLYVYKKYPLGYVFLDLDTIVSRPVVLPENEPIISTHFDVVDLEHGMLLARDGYTPPEWLKPNGKIRGLNMSFVCFGSESIRDQYIDAAIDFMKGNPSEEKGWFYMVFAEQMMPYQLLISLGITPFYYCPKSEEGAPLYHLGGYKRDLLLDENLKNNYISDLKQRIQKNHGIFF